MPINCSCSDTTTFRTLATLRTTLATRLGYGAQAASLPPGMSDLLTSFLQDAQTLILQRYPALRTERWFSWTLAQGERFYDLTENDEQTALATPVNSTFTTATTGGSLVPGTYYYRVSALGTSGETLASAETSQVVPAGTNTNTVTVTWGAVTGAQGYRIYGRTTGAEALIYQTNDGTQTSYTDDGSITPSGALPVADTTACTKTIDPSRITWVGVQRNSVWYQLREGIPPYLLGYLQSGWPQWYEVRQCIEIWPAPTAGEGTLRVKARFQQEPFSADADKPTVDDTLVFLLALANAKAHVGHPDAGNYVSQFESHLRSLIAGAHGTHRYIPGRDPRSNYVYVEPKPVTPFAT